MSLSDYNLVSLTVSERETLAEILKSITEFGAVRVHSPIHRQNTIRLKQLLDDGGFVTEQSKVDEGSIEGLWTLQWADVPGNGEYPEKWHLVKVYIGKKAEAVRLLVDAAYKHANSLPNDCRVDLDGFGVGSGYKVYMRGAGTLRYYRLKP